MTPFRDYDTDLVLTEEDINCFVKYILGMILSAYRDFEERVNVFDNHLSAFEQVEQAVHKKSGKFTKSETMETVPWH